jgi:hypothetical protein
MICEWVGVMRADGLGERYDVRDGRPDDVQCSRRACLVRLAVSEADWGLCGLQMVHGR